MDKRCGLDRQNSRSEKFAFLFVCLAYLARDWLQSRTQAQQGLCPLATFPVLVSWIWVSSKQSRKKRKPFISKAGAGTTKPILLHSCGWILLPEPPGALAPVALADSMLISPASRGSSEPWWPFQNIPSTEDNQNDAYTDGEFIWKWLLRWYENNEQSKAHAQESQGRGGSGLGFQDAENLRRVGLLRLQGRPRSQTGNSQRSREDQSSCSNSTEMTSRFLMIEI